MGLTEYDPYLCPGNWDFAQYFVVVANRLAQTRALGAFGYCLGYLA